MQIFCCKLFIVTLSSLLHFILEGLLFCWGFFCFGFVCFCLNHMLKFFISLTSLIRNNHVLQDFCSWVDNSTTGGVVVYIIMIMEFLTNGWSWWGFHILRVFFYIVQFLYHFFVSNLIGFQNILLQEFIRSKVFISYFYFYFGWLIWFFWNWSEFAPFPNLSSCSCCWSSLLIFLMFGLSIAPFFFWFLFIPSNQIMVVVFFF